LLDFSFLKGEIVSYSLYCEVETQYNVCPGETAFALRKTHYKPNKKTQEVLYWVEGASPSRLTNCAVVNRKNWECEYNDGSAAFGFQNGRYFYFSAQDDYEWNEFYVSRTRWLHQDCSDSIYPLWLCVPFHGVLRGE
jgi:hypothetical protein